MSKKVEIQSVEVVITVVETEGSKRMLRVIERNYSGALDDGDLKELSEIAGGKIPPRRK